MHPNALNRMDEIYNYCKSHWGARTAVKVKKDLIHTISLLQTNPCLGHIEPSLEDSRYVYRSITEGCNKIIYRESENGDILVMNLFDTRQHPDKLTDIPQ